MANRIILHLDLDAFYASCETKMNPELLGKPLVISSDPKDGKGRGVVLTANYKAREFGIKSAMPVSRAWKLCPGPQCTYVQPNFELYERMSAKVMEIIRKFCPYMEIVSVDEAFLDVSNLVHSYEDAREFARKLKSSIALNVGLTCSVGIGPNKTVAKITSDMNKPDGLFMVLPHAAKDFLAPLPVKKMVGIGPKTEKVLGEMGVETLGQLAQQPLYKMQKKFGKWGIEMVKLAAGEDDSPIITDAEPKSFNREFTFEEDTDDSKILTDALTLLAQDLHEYSVRENYYFKTVTVKVIYEGFKQHTKQKRFKLPVQDLESLRKSGVEILQTFVGTGKKIRKIGLRVSDLELRYGQKSVKEFAKATGA